MCAMVSEWYIGADHDRVVQPNKEKFVALRRHNEDNFWMNFLISQGVVGCGKGDRYLTALGRPTDIGFRAVGQGLLSF